LRERERESIIFFLENVKEVGMKKLTFLVGISFCVGVLFSGCTYKNTTLDYKHYNAYTNFSGGNRHYREISPVSACASGFIWEDCKEIASEALKKLRQKAQVLGGDGVIDVKWEGEDGKVLMPTCREEWGWFALILPGLGPWTKKACVEGVAVEFVDKK
jgi:hypothetical protein